MDKVYPLVMIGRRASGKTTMLSVLLGKAGFHSKNSGLDYSINTENQETRQYLIEIFNRLQEQKNASPTGVEVLPNLELYAEVNAHRIPFTIPDVAGEHFEERKHEDSVAEATKEELMKIISKAGVLVIVIAQESLLSKDLISYTNQVGIVLSELKKEKYHGFVPPIIVAISKIDRHPDFSEDESSKKGFLEKLSKEYDYLEEIRAIVSGAAGKDNFAIVPVSSFGGHVEKKEGDHILMIPPEKIKPFGLVEMLELAFKKLLIQNLKIVRARSQSELKEARSKMKSLKALLEFSPFEEIDTDIKAAIKDLEPILESLEKKHKVLFATRTLLVTGIFAVLFLLFYLIVPGRSLETYKAEGNALLENHVGKDNLDTVNKWLIEANNFVEFNKQLRVDELAGLINQIKSKYKEDFISAKQQDLDNKIKSAKNEREKIAIIDSLIKNNSNQILQEYLYSVREKIANNLQEVSLKNFLEKLAGLPVTKRLKEIKEKLNDPSFPEEKKDTLHQLYKDADKEFYTTTLEKRALSVKNKIDHARRYYSAIALSERCTMLEITELKSACDKYIELFPDGKMKDRCKYFLAWYASLTKEGIPASLFVNEVDAEDLFYNDYEKFIFELKLKDQSIINKNFDKSEAGKNKEFETKNVMYTLKGSLLAQLTYIDDDFWLNQDQNVNFTKSDDSAFLLCGTSYIDMYDQNNNKTIFFLSLTPKDEEFYQGFPGQFED